jgi:hypothetical protein
MKLQLLILLVFCSIQATFSWSCKGSGTSASPNQTPSKVKSLDLSNPKRVSSGPQNQATGKVNSLNRKDQKGSNATLVEIVPNQGIGELRVGMKRDELPKEAQNTIVDTVGFFHEIKFAVEGDTVEDVWISDLRTFPYEVSFQGKRVPRNTPIEALRSLFGPCNSAERGRGGALFNCRAGVTLGLDCERSEGYVQIRIKPR